MVELRPSLIATKPRRSFSGGAFVKYFIIFILGFSFGYYFSLKYGFQNGPGDQQISDDTYTTEKLTSFIQESTHAQVESSTEGDDRYEVSSQIQSAVLGKEEKKIIHESIIGSNQEVGGEPIVGEVLREDTTYTIQVAAFKDIERAIRSVNEIKNMGYDPYIVSVLNSKGDSWNLVKIGNFSTREEAEELAYLIQEKEHMEVIVEEIE